MSIESSHYPWLGHYPDDIAWHTNFTPQPVYALLDESVARYGSQVALDFFGKEYTYEKLGDMVNRVAAGMQAIGVGPETRVGLFMPNCPQFVMAYYAILKAGGTVVNFNPLYSEHEIEHQITDSDVEIMFTLNLRSLYNKAKPFLGKTTLRKIVVGYMQEAMPMSMAAMFTVAKAKEMMLSPKDEQHISFNDLLAYDPIKPDAMPPILPTEHIAVLQYTGGTTGLPKGAMLTHYNLHANTRQSSMWMGDLEAGKETILAVLPFFHVFAMTVALNLGVANGMKIVIHPRFELKRILNDIQDKKPTLMPGVSTLFATINNYKQLGKYDLTSLKACISGGGPLPLEVKDQFEKLTGCKLVEGYGLTESSPVTNCNPLFGDIRRGSIGPPLPGTIVEVIDPEDKKTPMPIGEIGEICIRGPQVMRGYWNQPEESIAVLKSGRLHTGDLGYMDTDGYFYIVDRLKEMIICGGYNVYPRNVEEAIYTHEAVAECSVIGLTHPRRGEMIKAFIVLKNKMDVNEDALKEYLRDHLTAYAIPHRIEFRTELPKSPVGKILKKELVREEMEKED